MNTAPAVETTTSARVALTSDGGDAQASGQRFDARIWPQDGKPIINGPVTVTGLPSFGGGDVGNVSWTMSGSTVLGKMMDDEGRELVMFEGTLSSSGAKGYFKTADGTVGSWSWDDVPPDLK